MGTEKLYDDMPYEKDFTAQVIQTEKGSDGHMLVRLDRTMFFPEEGGQTSDRGVLEGYDVIHVSIEGDTIIHEVCCPEDAFEAGNTVSGRIDWDHRFSNMQNHTGEHILSGILHRDYASENKGFHLSDSIVTLDTSRFLSEDETAELEAKANRVIYDDRPVLCGYHDPSELQGKEYRSKTVIEGPVRLVTIPGVDVCACCAPHVKHTGEIGLIKIIKAIRYKGGTRLTILSGQRAYEYMVSIFRTTEQLSHMLSENPDRLTGAVSRLMDEINGYKQERAEASRKLLEERIGALDPKERDALIFTEDTDRIAQRNAVNAMAASRDGICAVFSGSDEKGYSYILSHPAGDARESAKRLEQALGARGGGSKEMVQGSVTADRESIAAALFGKEL